MPDECRRSADGLFATVSPGEMAEPGTPHRDVEVLTWPMFGVAIRELAAAIARSGFRPDLVLTIARGGLTVGGTLAYALGTKNCATINVEYYTGIDERLELPVVLPPVPDPVGLDNLNVLIADDVADTGRMTALFEELSNEGRTLRGIVHAAGVSNPQTVVKTDIRTLESVFRPKVEGAWVLHRLSERMELDFFVMFSSVASVWGAVSLGPYAAANHFLDALAHHRRGRGLPALSVNWGVWASRGMATNEVQQTLGRFGMRAMPPAQATEALEYLLTADTPQAVVAHVDWNVFKPVYESRRRRPLFEKIEARAGRVVDAAAVARLRERLNSALPRERKDVLLAHVGDEVARVLGFAPGEQLDPERGLNELGLDSLMAVELKNQLELSLGVSLPPTVAFDYPSIEALTGYLAKDVLKLDAVPEPPSVPQGNGARASLAAEIQRLSEEEALDLLLDELKVIDEKL